MLEAAQAQPAWVLLAYLIAGVCFILALRGLSGPESSRRGNRTGMLGMAIAVATTLVTHVPILTDEYYVTPGPWTLLPGSPDPITVAEILVAIALGGATGLVTARKIQMTAMPQLVAAFHS